MKLVARDVKTIFCFRWDLCCDRKWLILCLCYVFAISKYSQKFPSYPRCNRQGMLQEQACLTHTFKI